MGQNVSCTLILKAWSEEDDTDTCTRCHGDQEDSKKWTAEEHGRPERCEKSEPEALA